MKKVNADVKAIIKAVGPFVIAVFLFLWMVKFGFGKVSELRLKEAEAEKNNLILDQKLTILNQLDPTTISMSSTSVAALPAENPSLAVLSQLRVLASERGLALTNLKTGSEVLDKSGLKKVEVTFDIESSRGPILEFLATIKNFAPISLIDKVKINEAAGVARATITIKAFWSELPVALPPITQAMSDLTPDERLTLDSISTLTQPEFTEILPSYALSVRSNPFDF